MNFERAAHHTSAIIGCFAWIPLAVWIVSCVNWSIVGDIDPATGVVGVGLALGIGYEAINPPVPELAPLTVLAVLATVVMFPFARAAMNRKMLRGIDVEALDKAYQALSVRPDNVVAKFKIAKVLFDLGMCGHALRIGEGLVASMPPRFFTEEIRTVKKWQMMQLDARFFNPISCAECGSSNIAGNLFCQKCGAAFLLHFAKGRIIGSRLGKKLISTWIALIAFLVGIPAAKALPPAACIATVVTMITVAACMVYFAFKDPTGGVAA